MMPSTKRGDLIRTIRQLKACLYSLSPDSGVTYLFGQATERKIAGLHGIMRSDCHQDWSNAKGAPYRAAIRRAEAELEALGSPPEEWKPRGAAIPARIAKHYAMPVLTDPKHCRNIDYLTERLRDYLRSSWSAMGWYGFRTDDNGMYCVPPKPPTTELPETGVEDRLAA